MLGQVLTDTASGLVSASIGQIATPIQAADVCSNEVIAGANTFDVEKVKADAAAIELSAEMAAVDVDAIRMTMFDQAI